MGSSCSNRRHPDPSDFARYSSLSSPVESQIRVANRALGRSVVASWRDEVAEDAPPSVGWKTPMPTSFMLVSVPVETQTRRSESCSGEERGVAEQGCSFMLV